MDQPTSDHQASGTSLSDLRITRLLEALAPGADRTEDRESMRTLFESLGPRDAAEAHLAAIATASAQSALDYLARAAGPGVSDQTAIRLRSSALAAGRTYATLLHTLRKPAAEPLATAKPASVQAGSPPARSAVVNRDEFQPRDRYGKPIPAFRTDLMTRAQVLAVLAYPRDPDLEAATIAEEEAMIAEQAAAASAPGEP